MPAINKWNLKLKTHDHVHWHEKKEKYLGTNLTKYIRSIQGIQ